MAETIEGQIADLLLTHLGNLDHSPALAISNPGIGFTPVSGETYLDAAFLPNSNVNHSLADDGATEHRGLFQVAVMAPTGSGIIAALDIAGEIVSHFAKGTRLSGDDITVGIFEKPGTASPMQEPDRVRIPVIIRYRAFA